MSAYAIAHLRTVDFNDEITEYIARIDSTLAPFDGRFVIHGKQPEVIEGPFPGMLVAIEFPDVESAHAWYDSDAYQDILALRTDNSDGSTIIVEGVPPGYRAASLVGR